MFSSDNFLDSVNQEENILEPENIFQMKPFNHKANEYPNKNLQFFEGTSSDVFADSSSNGFSFDDAKTGKNIFKKHRPIVFGKFIKTNKGLGINFNNKIENNLLRNRLDSIKRKGLSDAKGHKRLIELDDSIIGSDYPLEDSSFISRSATKMTRRINHSSTSIRESYKRMHLQDNSGLRNQNENNLSTKICDEDVRSFETRNKNLNSINDCDSRGKDKIIELKEPRYLTSSQPEDFLEGKIDNWSKKLFLANKVNEIIRSAPESLNNGERITLPVLGCGRSDSIKRISSETMSLLIKAKLQRKYVVVDARFNYEYEGGHISGAINIRSDTALMKLIMNDKPDILIFYCEFSSERGPSLARNFRNLDRNINEYPQLLFPEIYILKGGYKGFYESYKDLCVPNTYIQMHDKRFKKECIENQKRKY